MILIRNIKSTWTLFNIYLRFPLKLYILKCIYKLKMHIKNSIPNFYTQLKLADFNFVLFVI